MDNAEIAKQLFAALAGQDEAAVRRAVKDFRYEDAVRSTTETGFVEEHAVRGTLPDGTALELAVCVVATVKDGRVTDVREYLDSAASIGLAAALSPR